MRASIATTHTWFPNLFAILSIRVGLRKAAELIEILSAPSRNSILKSSTVLIPPPTLAGYFLINFLINSLMDETAHDYQLSALFMAIYFQGMNMDETTFSFSRKVLDRAMTIEMNEVDLNEEILKYQVNPNQLQMD